MENLTPYLIIIKCDDDVTVQIVAQAKGTNLEQELKDFYYQEYYEQQPDIKQYTVINLVKDPSKNPMINPNKMTMQCILANKAVSYSSKYEHIGN